MDFELTGRRVIVTGGSKGIGLAIAHAFAREGATPILVARSSAPLEQAAAAVTEASGIMPEVLALDLSDAAGVARLVSAAGDADILVNNAGSIPGGSLDDVDDATWRAAWDLKLYGYIELTRALLPLMTARGSGVIANIIGMAGAAPRAGYICGSTANAALMAFTQAVGADSQRHGVRVFGINPSLTRSDRMQTMLRRQADEKLGDAGRWSELTVDMPFGRPIEPAEIADLTVFGCSCRAAYLTGTVIDVDGGQLYASPR